MHTAVTHNATEILIPIHVLTVEEFSVWLPEQNDLIKNWLTSLNFKPEVKNYALLPDQQGGLQAVIAIVKKPVDLWSIAHLPPVLPKGTYTALGVDTFYLDVALGWCLATYQYTQFKASNKVFPQLFLPPQYDVHELTALTDSITDVRDWINAPAELLGPSEFSDVVKCVATECGAVVREIVGNALLSENFPAIHAVGRAASDAPRLLELHWGDGHHPRICLVGKGVCFDTGGLNLKTGNSMLLMKKDMGGAAHVLALAKLIITMKLPIALDVFIPVVENSISADAYRPGDVVYTRKGLTVEITNTDAEGRVILADALTRACELKPKLILDVATLTGAARIALGTELPMFFSNRVDIAQQLQDSAAAVTDPIWQLPLFSAYRESLKSTIADVCNSPSDSYAGAITAALFLEEFLEENTPWVHFDLMAWNLKAKAGRPLGGEAMGLRAMFHFIKQYVAGATG